jgi:membrane protease YdiL (CAAX protease family)
MRDQVRRFFLAALIATWGIGLLGLVLPAISGAIPTFSNVSPFYWLAAYAVSAIGVWMTARYDGRPGLRRLGQRLLPWNAGLRWYAIVVGGYIGLTFLALHTARWFGAAPSSMPSPRAALAGIALTLVLDPGPVGEEFGWRGFALPRLLAFRSPLGASLILGTIHLLWHVPLFFIPGLAQNAIPFPAFAIGVVSIAIFDTWLYMHTGASLLLAILVHLMANYCGGILGADAFPFFAGAEGLAALSIVARGGLRRRQAAQVASWPRITQTEF